MYSVVSAPTVTEAGLVVITSLVVDPGLTVIAADVPTGLGEFGSVPVMVGVSEASVKINPPRVKTPFVKVRAPLAGLVGETPSLGELVAVQVQLMVLEPV